MSKGEGTLVSLRRGERAVIRSLPEDDALRSQCIRLGLSVGAPLVCIERLPGGTVVVESARQEIALGRSLAERIRIEPSTTEEHSR